MADINRTAIIDSPLGGKGLATSSDVQPDSILLRIPNPYILIPDKASLSKICSWCFLPSSATNQSSSKAGNSSSTSAKINGTIVRPLKKCSGCQTTYYCSPACQRADWRYIHTKECVRLASLPDVPPTPVRALMRVLLAHRFGAGLDPRWANLQSHVDEIKKATGERWADIQLQARAAVKFSKREDAGIEVALAVLSRISCNAFRVSLPDSSPSGLCFEPLIALANHSCVPNSHVVFEGRTVTLRSLVPISQGDELLISYIDCDQPLNVRRNEIWGTYWFICHCPSCELEYEYMGNEKRQLRPSKS